MQRKRFSMTCLLAILAVATMAPSASAHHRLAVVNEVDDDDKVEDDDKVDGDDDENVAVRETRESRMSCAAPRLWNPLAKFGDHRHYFVAPGGDFEDDDDGWGLEGDAEIDEGNAPLRLGGDDEGSLHLPAGASATSPAFCIDLDYPSFRFFGRGSGDLEIDVVYPKVTGDNSEHEATLKAGEHWSLSADVDLDPVRGGGDWGWRKVAIRFRASAAGRWQIDNVLVDPRFRG
jgi:hypothetical protein